MEQCVFATFKWLLNFKGTIKYLKNIHNNTEGQT